MSEIPDTPESESTTRFEPLGASQSLEVHKNSLQLATPPVVKAEGQEGCRQGRDSTPGTAAATG